MAEGFKNLHRGAQSYTEEHEGRRKAKGERRKEESGENEAVKDLDAVEAVEAAEGKKLRVQCLVFQIPCLRFRKQGTGKQ